jgi:hypothetical protein
MALAQIITSSGALLLFSVVKGQVPQPVIERSVERTRAGVTGHAFRLEGGRSVPFELVLGRDHSSAADAASFLNLYRKICGTLVTYVDPFGIQSDHVMVIDTTREPMNRLIALSGRRLANPSTHWQFVRFVMQLTVDPTA